MNQPLKDTIINSYSDIALRGKNSCGCCEPTDSKTVRDAETEKVYEPDLGCGAPIDHAALSPGMTVLDLGSGSGREVFNAAAVVGPSGRVIGLDMTPAMIDLARKNAAILGVTNAEFRLGDIESMPLADGSVDRVISNCVINLTGDKRKAFSEIYRVLAPGGRLAISDITSLAPLPEEITGNPELWCGCVGGAMPTGEYLDAIRENGFRDVNVVSVKKDPSCGSEGLGLQSITVTAVK